MAISVDGPPIAAGGGSAGAGAATRTDGAPDWIGQKGRRILIEGGIVLSMDDAVGNFAVGDVLVEDGRIVEVSARIDAGDAAVIDARGRIVMPGLIDTHHHQFETALRSSLAHAVLVPDGRPENALNYYEGMLQNFSQHYRPDDVYVSEMFGGIAQLDAGVTTVMDVSQIHHSPEHSDAVIEALKDTGRRAVFGYFEGWGDKLKYPHDAKRIRQEHFSSDDQLLTMVMGGEIYIPGYEESWKIGRELAIPVGLHVVGTFGMQPTFDEIGAAGMFGPDNIFIHMTGMSDEGWKYAADAGARVSLAVPIEMHMRHGMPPIQKALDHGMTISLSTDVECTMTADMFTQMRTAVALQRMFANEKALAGADYPRLLQPLDGIRMATVEGAKCLGLESRVGTLTPGKQADIILLDTETLNVAPLNHAPGAVVTLMERSNVETVMVAGEVKKWKGRLLGFDVEGLRARLEKSRDHLFRAAGIEQDLFRA